MLTGPTGFDAALAARENLTVQAAVALPNGGGVKDLAAVNGIGKSLTIRRDLSGDLPNAATLIEGSTAASVEIDGDGRVKGAPHPLRAGDAEAWLNAPVEILAGYDGLRVPVFTGTMREFGFSHGARSLSLTARDGADVMKAPISIPWQGSQRTRTGDGAPRWHPINTAAVITHVLHKNNIRMTPRPREGCIVSVPGVGGYIADIGWVGVFGGSAPTDWLTSGKFGPTPTVGGESVVAFPSKATWAGSSRRMQVEFFFEHVSGRARPNLLRVSTAGTGTGSGSLWFEVANNEMTAYVGTGGQAVAMPAQPLAAGWHHVVLSQEVTGSVVWGNTDATVDGVRVVTNRKPTGTPGQLSAGYVDKVTFSPGGLQAINVYVYDSSTTPYVFEALADMSFKPEADVDRGKLDLTGMPEIEGRESWALLREIADAEFGMVGFGEAGRFFFKNRDTLNAATTPVAEWGVDLLETLDGSVAVDSVRTRVTARVPERIAVWSGRGAETEASTAIPSIIADRVYELKTGVNTIVLTGSTPFLPESGKAWFPSSAGQAWDLPVGLVMCADSGGNTWSDWGINDWARVRMIGPSTMELTVNNGSGTRYLCWPAAWVSASTPFGFTKGSPAIWVNGYSLPDADKTRTVVVDETNPAAAALWGDRVWDMGENVWRQNAASVRALAQSLLAGMSTPRAELSSVTLPADPRWQIGDPVRLTDWEGRLPSIMARITSIELTISPEVEGGMVGVYGLRQMIPTTEHPTVVSSSPSQTVTLGSTVTFDAVVTGGPTPTLQWTVNHVDIPGATMLRYSFTPTLADSGKIYRLVARNASGRVESVGAFLTVTSSEGSLPKVLSQTGPTMSYPGSSVDLVSSAAGLPDPTVQWQRSANGSTGWADVPSGTNPALRVANEYNDATVYFRAVWSNEHGSATTGNYGVFFGSD